MAALAAVEIDRNLAARLEGDLARQAPPGTLTIVRADILEIDLPALLSGLGARPARPARVIANLPYNVATAVILRLLRQAPLLRDLLVMVQREVALRILSLPGRKTYGGLSVLCQAGARVESVLRLRPGSFRPRPKVESEVIRLTLRDRDGRAAMADRQDLLRVAFAQRRKTLLNNLARLPPFPGAPPSAPSLGPAAASNLIRGAGLDPAARPETVPVEGFLALTDSWRAGRA